MTVKNFAQEYFAQKQFNQKTISLIKYTKIYNQIMKEEIIKHKQANYACILIRLSRFYIFLTLTQLLLASAIIFGLYFDHDIVIELAEAISAIFIIIDLIIRRCSQEKMFLTHKSNWADIIVLLSLLISISTRNLLSQKIFHQDSMAQAVLIVVRYLLQIYRVIRLLKTSKQLTRLQESEVIDLEINRIQMQEIQSQQL